MSLWLQLEERHSSQGQDPGLSPPLDQSRGRIPAPRPAREVGGPAYCSKCRVFINVPDLQPQASQLSLLQLGSTQFPYFCSSKMPTNLVKPWHSIIQPTRFGPHNCLRGHFSYMSPSHHLQLFTSARCPGLTSAWSLRRLCNWNPPLQQLTPRSHTPSSITAVTSCLPQTRCNVGGRGPEEAGLSLGELLTCSRSKRQGYLQEILLWGRQNASMWPGILPSTQPPSPRLQWLLRKRKGSTPTPKGQQQLVPVPISTHQEAFSWST